VKKRGLIATAVVVVVAVALLSIGWRCPIKLLTGIPCPGCGLSRATRLALQGDFSGATRMFPLVWLVVPVVAGFVLVEIIGYARTGAFGASRRVRGADALMLVTASLMFALWIARFFGAFGGRVL
jgi:hypothetical protein